jgi:AcrR family transcriptional regulator
MPRSPEENERIKEERKTQILSAALSVFAENGLAAAKMSDIAKAAGVSYGLVYRYFPSKEKLFVELVNDSVSSSTELVDEIRDLNLPPLERIKETFTQLFNYHVNDPSGGLLFRVMMQLNFHPHLWDQLVIQDLTSEPVFAFLYETVLEGQQVGEFVDFDPREIVLLLGYLAISFSLQGHELFNDELNADNIAALVTRMIEK